MREFKFNEKQPNNQMELKIAGNIFRFNPLSSKAINAVQDNVKDSEELYKNIEVAKSDANLSDAEKIKKINRLNLEACKQLAKAINAILGDGAYEVIFNERTLAYEEHNDVYCFILESMTEYSNLITNERTTNKAS